MSDTEVLDNEATSEPNAEEGQSVEAEAPEQGTGEAVSETTPEELYEVEGVGQVTLEDIKEAFEYKTNYKKWSKGLHEKGEEVNKQRKEIQKKEQELEEIRDRANKWQLLEKNMTPEAEAEIRKLLQEGDKVTPALQKFRQEYDQKFEQLEYEKAALAIKEKNSDFDLNEVEQFIQSIDFDKPADLLELAYYAHKGKNMPLELQKARAKDVEANRKAKGLPPISGPGKKVENRVYKTIDEALEAYNKEHGLA